MVDGCSPSRSAATLAALLLGLAGGISAIAADMAERKRTDEALRTGAARLRIESERMLALHRASTVLAGQTGDPSAVFDEVLSSAVTLIGATSGSLHRWFPDEGMLRAVRSRRRLRAAPRRPTFGQAKASSGRRSRAANR